jgi:hypothetical protein
MMYLKFSVAIWKREMGIKTQEERRTEAYQMRFLRPMIKVTERQLRSYDRPVL